MNSALFSTPSPSAALPSRRFFHSSLLVLALLAAGCATPPEPAPEPAPEPEPVATPVPPAPPRLLFAGFAMHSQSKAFRNDVLAAEKLALQLDPNALLIKLANPVSGQNSDWPQVTVENMELVFNKIAEVAKPEDKLILLISTHANPGTLNIQTAGKNLKPLTVQNITSLLAPVKHIPSIVILSSCYSGGFAKALRAPNRVVITATDVNRTSFKCQYTGDYTFFGDALFNQEQATELSVTDWMAAARKSIEALEKRRRLPASRPQIHVGEEAKAWAERPLKDWMQVSAPQ